MLKIILFLLLGFAAFVAYRIYAFLRATNAPILQGQRLCSVTYKPGRKLDIYQPTQQVHEKTPVLLHFHGGAWLAGTRKSVNNARFTPAFNALRERGYAIIAPNYTLAKVGQSPFPACLEDATDALAWLAQNADTYGFDLERVGLMGESAGAHIAMMTAYREQDTFSAGHSIDIRYVVDVYGPAAMEALYRDLTPMLTQINERIANWPNLLRRRFNVAEKLFGFNPLAEPERARQLTETYSPVRYLTASAPPTLVIHGTADRLVPVRQSKLLEQQLRTVGANFELHYLPGVGHSLRGTTPEQYQQVQRWIVDFVETHTWENQPVSVH
ncbi:MAG: alpha/beta hydrolase [Bacteroidota bacterium]